MVNQQQPEGRRRRLRNGRRLGSEQASSVRRVDYRNLTNPFQPQSVFSADEVSAIHDNALRVLEDLGIKILCPDARALFRRAGARVDNDDLMVWIGRDLVDEALRTSPKSFTLVGGTAAHDVHLALGQLAFAPGGGCPNTFDRQRGRRPGSLRDYEELMKLTASFNVLHVMGGTVEPQDAAINLRHYDVTRTKLITADKPPVVHARGSEQVHDCFEMIRLWRGLTTEQFQEKAHTFTVINTNSPRQIDRAMAQGIMDLARAGQLSIITPFCLAGAMAPITVAGALSLQHAEALAGIALSQLAAPGAPVM